MVDQTRVLTVRDVADFLHCHTSTVYRMLARGVIPAFRVGSDWRFNREELDLWRLGRTKLDEVEEAGRTSPSGG